MRRGIILSILLLVIGLITTLVMQNIQHPSFQTIEGQIYGTQYRITYAASAQHHVIRADIEQTLQHIDRIASNWRSDSELSHLNKNADKARVQLSPELRELLQLSEELMTFTNGAFNVTYDGHNIDLSAIAKGYAVDQICSLLHEKHQLSDFLVEIGGEIKTQGAKATGEPWAIGIHVPHGQTLRVELTDTSIASSGTYFKGKHIKNPTNQQPTANNLISCSVIHPSNTTADALATALMVMGKGKGLSWANTNKIAAVIIQEDGSVHYSNAWLEEP